MPMELAERMVVRMYLASTRTEMRRSSIPVGGCVSRDSELEMGRWAGLTVVRIDLYSSLDKKNLP
jgi:hypothetical protein